MLPPYLDQLNPERQEVFKRLSRFAGKFVLAGGTAIMLQIGHRASFDFDCFSLEKLPQDLPRKIKQVFGRLTHLKLNTQEQVTFHKPFSTSMILRQTKRIPSEDAARGGIM